MNSQVTVWLFPRVLPGTSSGLPFPVPPGELRPTSRSPARTHSWPFCVLSGLDGGVRGRQEAEEAGATNTYQSLEKRTPFDMVALWLDIVPKEMTRNVHSF